MTHASDPTRVAECLFVCSLMSVAAAENATWLELLQRIVNGGGRVEREHGLGRLRADLVILWPQRGDKRKFVVELKVLRGSLEKTLHDGLEQTAAYMDRCAAESGHLVIVDPGDGTWEDKTFHRVESHAGAEIHVWGM